MVKVARLRALGARVVQVGSEYVEAHEAAVKRAADAGALYCHAYDQPAVVAGRPVDVPVSGVAADSLGARRAGSIAYAIAVRTGVRSVLVPDQDTVDARTMLWERYRLLVEHGAAAAMAALATGAYRPADGELVAVILCGANTDRSRV